MLRLRLPLRVRPCVGEGGKEEEGEAGEDRAHQDASPPRDGQPSSREKKSRCLQPPLSLPAGECPPTSTSSTGSGRAHIDAHACRLMLSPALSLLLLRRHEFQPSAFFLASARIAIQREAVPVRAMPEMACTELECPAVLQPQAADASHLPPPSRKVWEVGEVW